MVIELIGSIGTAENLWTALSLVGLSGTFLFSKTMWQRNPGFDDFDPAEKIGLGGYCLHLQLFSGLLLVCGIAGILLEIGA